MRAQSAAQEDGCASMYVRGRAVGRAGTSPHPDAPAVLADVRAGASGREEASANARVRPHGGADTAASALSPVSSIAVQCLAPSRAIILYDGAHGLSEK